MPRPGLFLDAGGVLLDEEAHERRRAEIIVALLRERGLAYSCEDYARDAAEGVRLFVPRLYAWILWTRCPDEAWYRTALGEMRARWRQQKPPLKLMDGIAGVLPELAEICRLGILGQYGSELIACLAAADLLQHFSFRSTQDDHSITKPDPRYFERILQAAGVDPAEAVMVGDRIDKDVIPARMIGMRTIRVRTGLHRNQEPRTPEERPDAEIERLASLPGAVRSILRIP